MNLDHIYAKVAEVSHNNWKITFVEGEKENGNLGPYTRIKSTTDSNWVTIHGTNQVDIYNTPYPDLPKDWQKANFNEAKQAVDSVLEAKIKNDFCLEQLSSDLHDFWLSQNPWVTGILVLPYKHPEFPEVERQKDRNFILAAIEEIDRFGS